MNIGLSYFKLKTCGGWHKKLLLLYPDQSSSQCAPKTSYFDFPSACDLTWQFNNRVNDRNLFPFKEKPESCGKETHGIPGGPLIKNSKL